MERSLCVAGDPHRIIHIWIFDVVGFVVCHIEAVLVCLTGCMRKPEEI
jgi:hypothetical protein